jgi:hypothetical protein
MTEPAAPGALTDDEIATAFREAPAAQRTEAQVEAASQRFLSATMERAVHLQRRAKARARLRVAGAGAVAVVLVGVGALAGRLLGPWSSSTDATPNQATASPQIEVTPGPGAVQERVGLGPVEATRLHDGAVIVGVTAVATGHDALGRVVTGDAVVIVRRGLVEVVARADRLTTVRVIDGEASVLVPKENVRTIATGDRYDAPPLEIVPSGRPEARVRMNDALGLLARGDDVAAAAAFAAELERPGGPFAEEAAFWQAVALSRAGRSADATTTLEAFLGRYPTSSHRFAALGILGWELWQQGDLDGARRAFESALQSDDPRVRRSAQTGLSQLGKG